MRAKDLIQRFEQFAPRYLAEDGDPVGIQIGDPQQEVHRVLVTLDVRPEVVQEAIQTGAEMIFAHHPAMFRRVQNLDYRDPQKRMYGEIAAHNIVVYAAHTNLDSADGGMNDWLAAALQLQDTELLVPGYLQEYAELTIDSTASVSVETLARYRAIMLSTSSDEQQRLQVPTENLTGLVATLKRDYSDITRITSQMLPSASHQFGMGRVGNLAQAMTVQQFAELCKTVFKLSGLRLVSQHPEQVIRRVAVLGGDGGKFYPTALAAEAEAYVTGDVYYHTAHDMLAAGLNVIDPGHHVESICKPHLTALFKKWAQENQWDVQVQASAINTDPFTFI